MKIILIFIILILLPNCSINDINKTHGSINLNKKIKKIEIDVTNKNDVFKILGPPSTTSEFDGNKWFFIEKRITNTSIRTLGREKLVSNNVLVLEFNSLGIVSNKYILDKNKMNDLKFSKNTTETDVFKKDFLYNVMSSLRQKVNNPLKKSINKGKN